MDDDMIQFKIPESRGKLMTISTDSCIGGRNGTKRDEKGRTGY